MADFSKFTDAAVAGASPASAPMAIRLDADTSPDQAAQASALARRYGIPTVLAEAFTEDYRARALTEDARELFKQAPRLGSWIAERDIHGKLSHDDLQTLGSIEMTLRTLKNAPRAIASAAPGAGAGLYGAAAAPFEVAGQLMETAENSFRDLIGLPRYEGPQPGYVVGGFLRKEGRAAEAVASRVGPTVEQDAGVVERGVYSGLRSTAQSLLTLPIALRQGGVSVALGVQGAVTGGPAFACARK